MLVGCTVARYLLYGCTVARYLLYGLTVARYLRLVYMLVVDAICSITVVLIVRALPK